ncbi:dihydrofolate reductase [Novosphingobium profundi]|uniref:dihydrofolate reductase n=1 Tax=Novosphingobium profundi TaxID=1774954 RepID=UPI001BD9FE98|nr:dihydrofolate reductase [Novosphingobium profundi]MBT0668783.1 dihydrofolate reductase [Novosphingobium profundi]
MAQDIFLITARAANGVIGVDGALPWHLPADLRRFKALTMGKPMIMGRKTFESFPSPLPGRRHIVLTRSAEWQAEGAEVVHSVDEALACAGDGEVAVIGGAEIYALFLETADRIELTEVHADYPGDTMLPILDDAWREIAREEHPASGKFPAHAFVTLTRDL